MFSKIGSLSFCLIPALSLVVGLSGICGCGGSGKLLLVKDLKKAALLQVSSNKTIEWSDKEKSEATGSGIQSTVKLIGALSDGKNLSDASAIANHDAHVALNLSLPGITAAIGSGPVPLIPNDMVLQNANYQALVNDIDQSPSSIPAEGYKLLGYDKLKQAEQCKAVNAEAFFVVKIEFKKDLYNGIGASGQAKGGADVTVSLTDAHGETLWWASEFEFSDNSTGMISGAYNYEKMDTLCADAAVRATKKNIEKLNKKLAKAMKK